MQVSCLQEKGVDGLTSLQNLESVGIQSIHDITLGGATDFDGATFALGMVGEKGGTVLAGKDLGKWGLMNSTKKATELIWL